jgi:lipopolysaccharide export system permease protein
MRLLDRYLLREFLVPLFYILGGFLVFWIAFDLMTNLGKLQQAKLSAGDVTELYLAKLPEILVLITPVVLLLALLYAMTNHARHNEFTAIRAAGISLRRICVPYFMVGLVLGFALFAMNELWVPATADREDAIMHRHDPGHVAHAGRYIFVNSLGHDWQFGYVDADTLDQPWVSWKKDGDAMKVLAQRGQYADGVWTFFGAEEFCNQVPVTLDTNTEMGLKIAELTETPDQIQREVVFADRFKKATFEPVEIGIAGILDYLNLHRGNLSPKNRADLVTQLHGHIAAPLTCLVVVLIAIPFGAASGRRNLFVGVASAIVICFAYFVLLKLGLALGKGGYLTPWVAAWLPNLTFGLTAVWLMRQVR